MIWSRDNKQEEGWERIGFNQEVGIQKRYCNEGRPLFPNLISFQQRLLKNWNGYTVLSLFLVNVHGFNSCIGKVLPRAPLAVGLLFNVVMSQHSEFDFFDVLIRMIPMVAPVQKYNLFNCDAKK